MILTRLQGRPVVIFDSNVLESKVAIRQQESDRLAQSLAVEVSQFVLWHLP